MRVMTSANAYMFRHRTAINRQCTKNKEAQAQNAIQVLILPPPHPSSSKY